LNPVENHELHQLRQENARLKTLLTQHGIQWKESPVAVDPLSFPLSSAEKVALVRRLFRGRTDVYPLQWESAKGKSGYSPACGNEWKSGICNKPRIKCGECNHRLLLPVTDRVIYDHLTGQHTVGVYPLLTDNTCCFLAIDFDGVDWREDARVIVQSCHELDIPIALEISRSGNSAHVWLFFSDPVPAYEARQLGAALISYTCSRTHQLSLSSYDRLFPNQDVTPKGGFGNLIALPLQKKPRDLGYSVFTDENYVPYPDQWSFLVSITQISRPQLADMITRAAPGRHPLDVAFASEENENKPWQRPLANRLVRLAAFQNPEFYKAQAMRMSVWNRPRIISCAEIYPQHIGLPRGCLEDVLELLKENNIRAEIQDEREEGYAVAANFIGNLRRDQEEAINVLLKYEEGVLCAPTAFGKTVISAALVAQRKVNTLILVHRKELLLQWQERLNTFLELPTGTIGLFGGGKKKLSGKIDIAIMQSLSRLKDVSELLHGYGQIIVDECPHISAFSFESILKQVKSKYVVGLTATPIRRDGHHPIIFMQCGPIRHRAKSPENAPANLEVIPIYLSAPQIPPKTSIQNVFQILANDARRNQHIFIARMRTDERSWCLQKEHIILNYYMKPFPIASTIALYSTGECLKSNARMFSPIIATSRILTQGYFLPPEN
jgi:hypothetical protein